jgi:hypothetical protein
MRKEFRKSNVTPLQRDIVKSYRQSGLSQREFAARLPLNPKTGKPYNERTIRKWIGGERSTRNLEPILKQRGQKFLQVFKVNGEEKSFVLRTPRGKSLLQMLTDKDTVAMRKQAIIDAYRDPKKTDSDPMKLSSDDIELDDIGKASTVSGAHAYNLLYE